jgi:hypothetical protein
MFTLVLLEGFFDGFSKFRLFIVENSILIRLFGELHENYSMRWENTRKRFHRWLRIRRNVFMAGWAYAEMFKSRISRPNRIRLSKISFYRPLNHKDLVSVKKVYKKISCLCIYGRNFFIVGSKKFPNVNKLHIYIHTIHLHQGPIDISCPYLSSCSRSHCNYPRRYSCSLTRR